MSQVRSKGSKIERLLEKTLLQSGLKFKKHYKIVGTPDFVILKKRIAIFCDSHFWHGYKWKQNRREIKSNKTFWVKKITTNMKLDKEVNRKLKKASWHVVRFWEHEITEAPEKCIARIKQLII